jgi:4-amino-4-deoxy-L-arabinose transferase-like glycosyltransferase
VSDPRPHKRGPYTAVALIVAVTLPHFLLGLGERNIWIPLEARYALVAREMLETGHWVLPHLGGEVYADKPPLLFWSIALVSALGSGVTEWSARLPTAFAAVGVCLVTWLMGMRLFSSLTGLLGALVLATSGGFFWSGRQALPDMLLTLWTTGACWALCEWLTGKGRLAAVMVGVCMGLATLTKGPVGLILPTLSGLMYLTIRLHFLRPALRAREILMCGGAFLGVTLAWFVPAVVQGGLEYAQTTLLHHSLERYVKAWEHTAPWYFYLGAFPVEFLPWSLFLPQALITGVACRRHRGREGWWFALSWLVSILGFFSLSTGKRDIYILPAFPAAALLVGYVWSNWWRRVPDGVFVWTIYFPALVLALMFWGLAIGIWGAVEGLLPSRNILLLPIAPEMSAWSGSPLIIAGLVLAGATIARRIHLLFASIVGCTGLVMLVTVVAVYTPQFNQRYPIKSFAATIHAHTAPDRPLQLCGLTNDLALRFNLGRFVPEVHHPSDVIRFLGGEKEAFCIIEAGVYQRLAELTGHLFPVVARQEFDRATLLLISNRW